MKQDSKGSTGLLERALTCRMPLPISGANQSAAKKCSEEFKSAAAAGHAHLLHGCCMHQQEPCLLVSMLLRCI